MIHSSSGADFFRVSSPQVSLSVSKKSFCSHMYFLSIGSFNMAKNSINLPYFWMIHTFPRPEILQGDQKKTGLSKYGISFSFVCLGFLPKIKKCQKHVFVIFEWSGFFGAKRAVSPFIIYHGLTLCQKSKKSLERLSGKSVSQLTN